MGSLRLPHGVIQREGVDQEDGMPVPLIEEIDNGTGLQAQLHLPVMVRARTERTCS